MLYDTSTSYINFSYLVIAAAAAKSLQSCPTLCDPWDGSPSGFPIPGILQARTLEWVAISFSKAWKRKVKVKLLSPVRLLATPWTAAYQAPLSTGFSRQEYWSGVPLPSPRLRLEVLFWKFYFGTDLNIFSIRLLDPAPFSGALMSADYISVNFTSWHILRNNICTRAC